MFEYYGDMHVYCPVVGADEPLGSNVFQIHNYTVHLPILRNIYRLNDILVSPFKCIDDLC